jgi:uncharacterized protein
MRVAALRVELHLPATQSIKEKRAVLRPVIEGLKRLGSYSVAEVGHHDSWQRAAVGIAVVAPDGESLAIQIEKLHRYLEARHDLEVVDVYRSELEEPE